MGIIGKTFQQFLPVYLRKKEQDTAMSKASLITIDNIIASFIQLSSQGMGARVSVKDLATRAGYSRTTVYGYFTDSQDVLDSIEGIISMHLKMNAKQYFKCFLGLLSENEEREVLDTINNFSPYVSTLLRNYPDYEDRYISAFNEAFSAVVSAAGVPERIQSVMLSALSAAMVGLLKEYYHGESALTLRICMECVKIMVQSIASTMKSLPREAKKVI